MMVRIFSVDDSSSIRRIVRRALKEHNVEIIEAENGQQCLDLLADATHRPNLILMDVSMPRLNGRETLRRLRSEDLHFGIPVVMLTAEGDAKSRRDYLRLGAAGSLIKPFSRERLVEVVERMSGARRLARAA